MKLALSRNSILDYLAVLFFSSLPFHRDFSTIAIGLILLFSFWNLISTKSFSDVKWDWFLPLLFLYYLVSTLLSSGPWSAIEKRLLLIGIPIVFWLNPGYFKAELKPKIYWGYVFGIVLAEAICLIVAVRNSVSVVNGSVLFSPKIFPNADYDFLTAAVRDGNYFFGQDLSLFLHPIYFGLYIVLAQFFIFELFNRSKEQYLKFSLIVIYFSQFIFLFLLSSKSAIISSLILAIYLVWRINLSKSFRAIAIPAMIAFGVFFIMLNPRMRIFTDTFVERLSINPNARFGHDLRILSWDASIDIIKDNWFYGVGEGNKDAALNSKYTEKGYIIPAKEGLNSHNQYLDFLIGGGLIGFGIYLFGLIRLLIRGLQTRKMDSALLIFLLLFSITALFENLLSRHAGVLLFAVFVTFLDTSRHGLKPN